LRDDPRFATNEARVSNRPALVAALNETFAARDAGKWLAVLREAGLPCGPINAVPDVFAHPQAQARGLALEAEHPTAGPIQMTGFPYKLSQTPAEVRQPPSLLGQHTEEVLVDLLGYSAEQVAAFQKREII